MQFDKIGTEQANSMYICVRVKLIMIVVSYFTCEINFYTRFISTDRPNILQSKLLSEYNMGMTNMVGLQKFIWLIRRGVLSIQTTRINLKTYFRLSIKYKKKRSKCHRHLMSQIITIKTRLERNIMAIHFKWKGRHLLFDLAKR